MQWGKLDLAAAPADGPVAFHSDLSAETLLDGYRHGLFPFPASTEEQKIISEVTYEADVAAGRVAVTGTDPDPYAVAWCSPDPRPVLFTDEFRIQRSLSRQLRNKVEWTTTLNSCFTRVVQHCRADREPRWLTDELVSALVELHEAGHAHSVEVWEGGELVGGTFGVRTGGVLSADSQFALRSGAAKVAVACLVRRVAQSGGVAVDVQHPGGHATLLGAKPVRRVEYLELLRKYGGDDSAMPADVLPARSLAA